MVEVYAALWVIGGDIDPDEVVANVGLAPASIRRAGDVTRADRPFIPGCWFTTQDRLRTSIEEALDDLLADLGPGWSYLTTIQDRCDLAVECYVKLYEPNDVTTLGIESRHVAKIAELGAGFGIDYYDFSGPSGVPRPQPH